MKYLESILIPFIFNRLLQSFSTGAQAGSFGTLRMNTPPPLYRSTNSLSMFVPNSNNAVMAANSNAAVTQGLVQDHNALSAMSVVMESLQAQTQPLIKEINYLDLD